MIERNSAARDRLMDSTTCLDPQIIIIILKTHKGITSILDSIRRGTTGSKGAV